MGLLNLEQSGSGGLLKFHQGPAFQRGGLLKFHQGPAFQEGSGWLGLLLKGVTKLAPKIVSGSKSALKASAIGLKKAAKSNLAKELGKSLKETAIATASDTVANLVSGEDPSIALQQGVEEARSQVATALKRKAQEQRNKRKRKVPKTTIKSKKKKKNSYDLFEK